MGLADELEKSSGLLVSSTGTKCTVAQIYELLDEEDVEALKGLMNDPRYLGSKITDFLHHYGSTLVDEDNKKSVHLRELCGTIGANAVQRHRRGACRCRSNL